MDKQLEDYLKGKYGDDYEGSAKQKYDDAVSTNSTAQMFAGLGDVIAGKGANASDDYFSNLNKQAKENTLGQIEKDRKSYMETAGFENQQKEAQTKQAAFDPNSSQSVSFRKMMERSFPDVAKTYGDSWANVSAGDQENIFKPLKLREDIDSRKQQAQILAGEREEKRADKIAEKARPSDKQIETFTDFDNASSDLNNLMSKLGDKSDWTGPVDGRVPDMLIGNDQVAWRTAVGKYKDAYRKAITGAGAGPSEIAILETRLPSANDTLANFKAKSDEALQELKRRKETFAKNLTSGGKDISKFVQEENKTSISSEDQSALQWANQHPDDPRAKKIMERLSTKIGAK